MFLLIIVQQGLFCTYDEGSHFNCGSLAALASSNLDTGVVCGASLTSSGCFEISSFMAFMASIKASKVSKVSDSVGSTINASSTIKGKYMVGAWNP